MVRRENGWRMIFHYYGCVITLKTCLIVVLLLEVYMKLGSDLSFHSWGSCFCLHFKTIVLIRNVEKLHTADVTVFSVVNHLFVS